MSGDRIVHGPEAERNRLYNWEGQNRSQRRVFGREASIRLFIAIAALFAGMVMERFL